MCIRDRYMGITMARLMMDFELPNFDEELIADSDVHKDSELKIADIDLRQGMYPIPLDIVGEIKKIKESGVIRKNELRRNYEKVQRMLSHQYTVDLCQNLFWLVFCVKFRSDDLESIQAYRGVLSERYSKWFVALETPKDELSNVLIFILAYATHILFYKTFPNESAVLKFRFILDCYHVAIYELNGLFVSDVYVQMNIEKIFTHKFFFYENERRKISDLAGSGPSRPLFGEEKLEFNPEALLRIPGGIELAMELTTKMRQKTKSTGKKPETAEAKKPKDLMGKANGKDEGEDGGKEELKATGDQGELRATMPKGLFKMKFNCTQISPTLSRFLNNQTGSLPFQKKKVIERVESRAHQQFGLYFNKVRNELERTKSAQEEREAKALSRTIEKKNILDTYDISKYEQNIVEERVHHEVPKEIKDRYVKPVSYTHLTLPTIYSV
eukprot:TRINITY_DN11919_c0_g1_i1.p1 TRINITY_DN11919_c0_g1~~TRINITY_DN11919_c0_g1_i1.p1  ORF type:complete len:462 (+),score=92.05 TRINITY_DN11919_c0_g1_i1:61-1386(+)